MQWKIVFTTTSIFAVRETSWWAADTPAVVMTPAVKAFHKREKDRMLSKALPVILQKQSVSTARRRSVFTIPIISVSPTMWISRAVAPVTAAVRPARHLRKTSNVSKGAAAGNRVLNRYENKDMGEVPAVRPGLIQRIWELM